MTERQLTYSQAINEATDLCLARDPSVYLIGLGVPDPKKIFGTTAGLQEKYGDQRVMDMPTAEAGMTGVVLGSALGGMRPIMVHQRMEFALLALEQIVNQAANWHYMFGGKSAVPFVMRMLIGRGWGQGPQHSQALHALFAHIPGLRVAMPVTPHDAKGMLIEAVADNNPVIFIEHRWLHNVHGPVPEDVYRVPFGKARVAREGGDVTIVAASYMVLEALKAAEWLAQSGVHAEVIDVRTLRPLDRETIFASVRRTGRLVAADLGWGSLGFSAEIIASVSEELFGALKAAPIRVSLPEVPSPSTPALARHYYPRAIDVYNAVRRSLGQPEATEESLGVATDLPLDVPDKSFTGPF